MKKPMNQQNRLSDDIAKSSTESAGAQHGVLPAVLLGFDLAAGLQRLQGNRALYIKLLGRFAGDYGNIAAEIEQAIEAGDRRQVHALAHNLKGLAGNLSATDLFAAARALDDAVKSDAAEPERLHAEFTVLRAALDEALASARSILPPDEPTVRQAAEVDLPNSQLLALVRRIREAIDLGDVMSIHESAAALAGDTLYAARIGELADAFDFDGLLSLADEMEQKADR